MLRSAGRARPSLEDALVHGHWRTTPTGNKKNMADHRPSNNGASGNPRGLRACASGPLKGSAQVPGDKSISHRALIFGALAVGETQIDGLLESDDVRRTAAAMAALGAEVEQTGAGQWRVWGRGIGALREPEDVIDLGNSGTGARLLTGLLAGQGFNTILTGDASLRSRPMARVTLPLAKMGARFVCRSNERLPMMVMGSADLQPIVHEQSVASAQVKTAVLLAGLHAPGETSVIEVAPTRDHTERMLRHFGATVALTKVNGRQCITVTGEPELSGQKVQVPADPSSAAFPAVAGLLVPGSEIRLAGVCRNPLRAGLYDTLVEMGADLTWQAMREEGGEPVGDLVVRAGPLRGIEVPADRAPTMIDEYPVLAMAAACAKGTTIMRGLGELRVKESDRLGAVARGLAACGVDVEEGEDWLIVHGKGKAPRGGGVVASVLDHRIAMSFLVLGLASDQPVVIDDGEPIASSFPSFVGLMGALGADIREVAD